jgi:hypothetical protein
MTYLKTIAFVSAAALLIGVSGPVLAKKQSGEVTTQKQAKPQAQKTCRRNPPPFMYNPRFMNRGFFKKKCPTNAKSK